MRCPQCESKVTKRNKFCPECGTAVIWKESDELKDAQKKSHFVIVILSVLLVVAIIAIGWLILSQNGNTTEETTGVEETTQPSVGFADDPTAISKAAESVVKLNCYDKNGDLYATGSGFAAFEKGVIVTNYHVIEDKPERIEIVTEQGVKCEIVGVVGVSAMRDIAILYYQHRNAEFDLQILPISSNEVLEKGEKVVAIGSPLGLTNVVSTGVFSGYTNSGDTTDIQFTASISSGSSGGALFDDNGQVIGITYASFEAGQNLNLAVPMGFVESLWKGETRTRQTLYEFYDSLIPHYTVDYVQVHYKELSNTEFYLDYWASSYGKTSSGYVAFCASNYNGIFDPAENVQEKRFQADMDRYPSSSLLKLVYYGTGFFTDAHISLYFGDRGTERSIKCRGVEWSQVDNKPFVLID